jgi:hypothetical protein
VRQDAGERGGFPRPGDILLAYAQRMNNAPVPPPAYHRAAATALHVDTLVTRMHLLEICRAAAQLASSSVYHRHTAGLCLLRRVCQLLVAGWSSMIGWEGDGCACRRGGQPMRRPRKPTPPTTEAIDAFCAAFDDLFARYEERRALRQYLART